MSLVGSLLTKNKRKEEIKMKNVKKLLLVIVLTLILGLNINVSAKELDEHAFDNLPETFNIDVTEKYYTDHREEIEEKAKNDIIDLLKKDGYELSDDYEVSVRIDPLNFDFDGHNMFVILYKKVTENGVTSVCSHTMKSKLADTDSYKSIRSKLKKIATKKFYYLAKSESSEVYTYNGKTKISTDKVYDSLTRKIKNEIADDSISVQLNSGCGSYGGDEDEDETLEPTDDIHITLKEYKESHLCYKPESVVFYKDKVELGSISLDLYLGVGFSTDGQSVTIDTIDSKNSVYTEMKDVLAKKGYSNIINAYELKLVEGTINGKMKATIPVDSKYNGKNVIVLHKKADGTYEEFNSVVKDGEVTIEVTELSPFMVALNGNESNATQVSNVVSNNAQTSSINIILLSILSVSSLCGILYLVLRKKRVA